MYVEWWCTEDHEDILVEVSPVEVEEKDGRVEKRVCITVKGGYYYDSGIGVGNVFVVIDEVRLYIPVRHAQCLRDQLVGVLEVGINDEIRVTRRSLTSGSR